MSLTSILNSTSAMRKNVKTAPIPGMTGRNGQQLALRSVTMEGIATGLLFEMVVEQRYENASSSNIEAVYTFPLPVGAVLLGLELELAGKILQGKVEPKSIAEAQYESAIEGGHAALMVERATDGLYTVSLGNLMAGEVALVRYRYGQLLGFTDGRVRVTVPTVIAPRFGSAHAAGLQAHQVPATHALASYGLAFNVRLRGELCKGTVSSPSHPLALRASNEEVHLALGANAVLDRDVVLTIDGLQGRSLAVSGRDGDATVVLASFCPQATGEPQPLPLALKILVDCSGSMAGDSMAGAKRALHQILSLLEAGDRFSYSRFGSSVVHDVEGLLTAGKRNIRTAASWVGVTDANLGGTAMGAAMQSTFALSGDVPSDMLLITDGEIWETDDVVAAALQAGQRVFVVGIGAAPSACFLMSLAQRTGGACEMIAPGEDVGLAVLRCFQRLRQARLLAPQVEWHLPPDWHTTPQSALFYGETLHVFGGFASQVPGSARLCWPGSDGVTLAIPAPDSGGDTLARMAAAARIEALGKADRDALAMQYQLVTDSTNLIVVHERSAAGQAVLPPVVQTVPQMLVAGGHGAGTVAAAFDGMRAPAVWRRESASDQLRVMERKGMETYDIPVFFRRSEPEAVKVRYNRDGLAEFLQSWSAHANLPGTGGMAWKTLPALQGWIPPTVYAALCDMRSKQFSDADVLTAFFAALTGLASEVHVSPQLLAMLQRFEAASAREPALLARMRQVLAELMAEEMQTTAPPSRRNRLLSYLFGGRNDVGARGASTWLPD